MNEGQPVEVQTLLPFERRGDFEKSTVERCARVCDRVAEEKEERWMELDSQQKDRLAQMRFCEMETAKMLARRIRRRFGHV